MSQTENIEKITEEIKWITEYNKLLDEKIAELSYKVYKGECAADKVLHVRNDVITDNTMI